MNHCQILALTFHSASPARAQIDLLVTAKHRQGRLRGKLWCDTVKGDDGPAPGQRVQ